MARLGAAVSSEPDLYDRQLMRDAFRGWVAYDTQAGNEFTLNGEDVDEDTRVRLKRLLEEGFLEYFRDPAERRGTMFFTGLMTTPKAWRVME